MTGMRRLLPMLALVLLVGLAPARAEVDAGAGQAPSPGQRLDQVIRGMASMLRDLLDTIPQYGAPRVNDRGDIVIPRVPSAPEPRNQQLTKT